MLLLFGIRSTTLSKLCVRGNGSASAMCGRISPLGVFVRFGTMQVASPDLLPMVVLAGSRVRHSQIIQYYNRLIGKRFILIYAIFYCVAFASPGSALYCRGLVLVSFFFVFLSEAFLPSAALHFPEPRKYERVCLYTLRARVSLCGVSALVAPFSFSFCGGLFRLRGLRFHPGCVQSVARVCLSFRVISSSVFPSSKLAGPSGSPPVIWGICHSRRFRSGS